MIGRRGFITGLVAFVAAPAIVRVGLIMPVKVMPVLEDVRFDADGTPWIPDTRFEPDDVRYYGADPKGKRDSTRAFQRAIAAAPDGGTVKIPFGRYLGPPL